jgi:hypothetical protein
VVEIALEPITGLRLSELLATIDGTIQNERASIIQRLMTLERTISDLYARASPKVVRISADAAELLSMLSRESTGRLRYLERYG